MAIKKIKLPDNTTVDINDSRLPAVTATDNGKVLSVSGGIWSANSKPSYTLDEVSDGSTRKLANYLPLSGGTLSNSNYGESLIIKRNASSSGSVIAFRNNDGLLGYIGITSQGVPCFRDMSATTHTIYHSGNSNKSDVAWACSGLTASGDLNIENTSSYKKIYFHTPDATMKAYVVDGSSANESVAIQTCFNSQDPETSTYVQSYPNRCVLALQPRGGNVGVRTATPTEALYVSGNIAATGTITPGSDSRIKDNQKDISSENAFSVIEKLKPKTWVWNEKSDENLNGKGAAGLVAQEVKEILPDAVTISENRDIKDFHSLNYNTIQGYEIAAIKGLIEEVKSLKAEIAELKNQIK